jgi:3-deoxy-D-manno-octulosonic acid kinase
MHEVIVHRGSVTMIGNPDLVTALDESLFDPGDSEQRIAGGRGGAYFVTHNGKPCVLRRYLRGGLVRFLNRAHFLWSGLDETRMLQEFRLLRRIHALGLPVPEPVAVRICRRGLLYQGEIVMTRIAANGTLAEQLIPSTLPAPLWAAIGRAIRQLHAAGVDHADLNANNILLRDSQVFFIDFDKARIGATPALDGEHGNLRRLQRSLLKLQGLDPRLQFDDRDWQSLLEGYCESANG